MGAPTRERFQEVLKQLDEILADASSARLDEQTPIRRLFEDINDRAFSFRRAEALVTEALGEFPLHPYLLYRRGLLRLLLMTAEAESLALEEARADFETAATVSPNDVLSRIELAQFAYVHLEDNRDAADRFAGLTGKLSKLLCESVAGHVRALADDGQLARARSELQRWQRVFPDNPDLADASEWLKMVSG